MEVPLIGKVKRPLPWLMGLIAAGILGVGGVTSFVIMTRTPKIDLNKLTVPVQAQNLTVRITANGSVVPIQSVNLSPKTAGRLAKLFVEQGDQVQQGQTLAQMENADLQAQLLQAQANLNKAQASLAEARAGSRQEEINQAQARLAQAQANLDAALAKSPTELDQARSQVEAAKARVSLAQARAQRYGNLAEQGAVSVDRRDEALTEQRNALASLNEAQRRLEQQTNTTRPEIAQFQLTDYKVRILDGGAGTSAKTRVLIESSNGQKRWTTVGVSPNILEASYQAVVEGIEYGLLLQSSGKPESRMPVNEGSKASVQ